MKCDYCGATMPDPPSAPNYSESYKKLREQIGRLEYNNGVLVKDKKKVEDWLIGCRENLGIHQSSEKVYKRGKKIWKGIAIFLMATNALWFIMVVSLAS